jgi:hypothetical protein
MVGYRCYILDAEDHILQAYELDCATEAEVASRAEDLLALDPYHRSAEVWQSTNRVMKLERSATPAPRFRPGARPERRLGSVV